MHGLVALGADDVPLRPAILWNDQRTAAECAEIERRVGLERLIELTGNRALTGFTAPKLLWLRAHEPDVYAEIRSVLLPKDYVRLKLFGERAIDVADASGTLLFDVAHRAGARRCCEALERAGRVAAAGVRVAGDRRCGRPGGGSPRCGRRPARARSRSCSARRASSSERCSEYRADPEARVHVFCHAVPGTWHAMGVMLSAAGSLQWLHDAVAPGVSFDELVAEAEGWPPGAEGLLFAPYLAGERTPHADPEARGAFVGLSVRHDRGALVRAVLEGVAYALRDSLELLRELGVQPELGRVSGGGARSALWRTIVASVLDVPLETTAAEEGSAFGAALLAGARSGVFSDPADAAARCVQVSGRTNPDPGWVAAYADGYARFRRLYPALSPLRD